MIQPACDRFLESLWYNLTSDTSESRTIVCCATMFLCDNNEEIVIVLKHSVKVTICNPEGNHTVFTVKILPGHRTIVYNLTGCGGEVKTY